MQDSEGCDACGEGGEPASLALALPMLVGTTTLVIQEISGAVVPDTSFLEPPTHVFGLEEVPVVVWLSQMGFFCGGCSDRHSATAAHGPLMFGSCGGG